MNRKEKNGDSFSFLLLWGLHLSCPGVAEILTQMQWCVPIAFFDLYWRYIWIPSKINNYTSVHLTVQWVFNQWTYTCIWNDQWVWMKLTMQSQKMSSLQVIDISVSMRLTAIRLRLFENKYNGKIKTVYSHGLLWHLIKLYKWETLINH